MNADNLLITGGYLNLRSDLVCTAICNNFIQLESLESQLTNEIKQVLDL